MHTASNGLEAIQILHRTPVDVVLTDLKMPERGGLDLLDEAGRVPRPVATILMTGFGTVDSAVDAMKRGASDFILKPFRLKDVYQAIERAMEGLREGREVERIRALVRFYELALTLTEADALPRLYGTLAQVAQREVEAEEVALWMRGRTGWEAVARGGQIRALARVDPGSLEGLESEGTILAAGIRVRGEKRGLLAVAGGAGFRPEHAERLGLFASVVGNCLERVPDPDHLL